MRKRVIPAVAAEIARVIPTPAQGTRPGAGSAAYLFSTPAAQTGRLASLVTILGVLRPGAVTCPLDRFPTVAVDAHAPRTPAPPPERPPARRVGLAKGNVWPCGPAPPETDDARPPEPPSARATAGAPPLHPSLRKKCRATRSASRAPRTVFIDGPLSFWGGAPNRRAPSSPYTYARRQASRDASAQKTRPTASTHGNRTPEACTTPAVNGKKNDGYGLTITEPVETGSPPVCRFRLRSQASHALTA